MAKIIQFPDNRIKYLFAGITLPMLKALVTAVYKEHHNLSFNKSDLGGAFKPLYMEGLIGVKNIVADGKTKNEWYVTDLGKRALQSGSIKSAG